MVMIDWFTRHSALINAFASLAMLGVWVVYLQLFIHQFRRQRRTQILINRSDRHAGAKAACIVTNMSAEPIYITNIIGTLYTDKGCWTCPITEFEDLTEDPDADSAARSRQGALPVAHSRDMGSFANLMRHTAEHGTAEPDDGQRSPDSGWRSFRVQVVAAYGTEDLIVAAERDFDLVHDGRRMMLTARTVGARQIRGKKERRQMSKLLEREL